MASIRTDEDLKAAIETINYLLQQTHDYLGNEDDDRYDAKEYLLRFPRGYIRKADELRKYVLFIDDATLKKNISYTLIMNDFYCWALNRTDIHLTLREMVIKSGISLMAGIVETLVKKYSSSRRYNTGLKKLLGEGVIDQELHDELFWLWDFRQGIHLFLLDEPEHRKYNDDHYNRAVRAGEGLVQSLRKVHGEK